MCFCFAASLLLLHHYINDARVVESFHLLFFFLSAWITLALDVIDWRDMVWLKCESLFHDLLAPSSLHWSRSQRRYKKSRHKKKENDTTTTTSKILKSWERLHSWLPQKSTKEIFVSSLFEWLTSRREEAFGVKPWIESLRTPDNFLLHLDNHHHL